MRWTLSVISVRVVPSVDLGELMARLSTSVNLDLPGIRKLSRVRRLWSRLVKVGVGPSSIGTPRLWLKVTVRQMALMPTLSRNMTSVYLCKVVVVVLTLVGERRVPVFPMTRTSPRELVRMKTGVILSDMFGMCRMQCALTLKCRKPVRAPLVNTLLLIPASTSMLVLSPVVVIVRPVFPLL